MAQPSSLYVTNGRGIYDVCRTKEEAVRKILEHRFNGDDSWYITDRLSSLYSDMEYNKRLSLDDL